MFFFLLPHILIDTPSFSPPNSWTPKAILWQRLIKCGLIAPADTGLSHVFPTRLRIWTCDLSVTTCARLLSLLNGCLCNSFIVSVSAGLGSPERRGGICCYRWSDTLHLEGKKAWMANCLGMPHAVSGYAAMPRSQLCETGLNLPPLELKVRFVISLVSSSQAAVQPLSLSVWRCSRPRTSIFNAVWCGVRERPWLPLYRAVREQRISAYLTVSLCQAYAPTHSPWWG